MTKQIGCSTKKNRRSRRRKIKGGDAYNSIPARYIYPLNEYQSDPQYTLSNARVGGSRKFRNNKRHSRKYLRRNVGGGIGALSGSTYVLGNIANQPIGDKFSSSNAFKV